jgi:hypothetical protein
MALFGFSVVLAFALYHTLGSEHAAEESASPAISAVRLYRQRFGTYPNTLNDVIKSRLLASIPRIPSGLTVRRGSLEYFADQDLDFFCLSFTETPTFEFGPPRVGERAYVSYREEWVRDDQGLLDLTDSFHVAMDRAGSLFRQDGSSNSLELFVNKAIHYSKRSPVYPRPIFKHHVVETLGAGDRAEVDGIVCLRYSARDEKQVTYYLVTAKASNLAGDYGETVVRILRSVDPPSSEKLREVYHEQ